MKIIKSTKLWSIVGLSVLMASLYSCDKKDKDADGPKTGTKGPIELDCDFFSEDRILVDDPDADVDYIISCMMRVNGEITVEPGVVIEFKQGAGINVEPSGSEPSSFSAVGTSARPIIFRGVKNEKAYWTGIRFRETSSSKNELTHVKIEDAGNDNKYGENWSGAVILAAYSPNLKMTNSTISNSKYGINVHEKTATLTFKNNTLTNNETPVKTHPNQLIVFDGTSSYTGNTNDYVFIDGYATGIDRNGTWHKIDVPYRLEADFSAGHGGMGVTGNLSIQAGVEVIMTSKSKITVGDVGSLAMNGTSNDKIIFRGEEDVAGYWEAIRYNGSPNPLNKMSHVEIRNGGKPVTNPQSDPNGALCVSYSYLPINDITFVKCFDFGISLSTDHLNQVTSTFTYSNLTFTSTPREFGNYDNESITP